MTPAFDPDTSLLQIKLEITTGHEFAGKRTARYCTNQPLSGLFGVINQWIASNSHGSFDLSLQDLLRQLVVELFTTVARGNVFK
jgi:hypothetical protein